MEDRCVCCGAIIPEGRQVCPNCERSAFGIDANVENAYCCETVKIKTHHARIVVDGTAEKPYFSIEWFDPTKKEYYLGYSSYFIGNVFKWLEECFEIIEASTVDAVEAVHARWSPIRNFGGGECYGYCTNCKTPVKADNATGLVMSNRFCHWCGAKMDGGDEDG